MGRLSVNFRSKWLCIVHYPLKRALYHTVNVASWGVQNSIITVQKSVWEICTLECLEIQSVIVLFFKSLLFSILVVYFKFFFNFLFFPLFLFFSTDLASMKLAQLPLQVSGARCQWRVHPLPPPLPAQPARRLCLPFPSALTARLLELPQEASPHLRGIAPTLSPTRGDRQLLPARGPPASPFCPARPASLPSLVALKQCLPALPDRDPAAWGHLPWPPHPVPWADVPHP